MLRLVERQPGYHYLYLGQCIKSTIPLTLKPVLNRDTDVEFCVDSQIVIPPADAEPIRDHQWDTGDTWLRICKQVDTYYLEFPGLAVFAVTPTTNEVRCLPRSGVTNSTLQHLFQDQILPRLFSHQGSLLLHAAAIAIEDAAVLIMGSGGLGKSTLTASFGLAGFPVVADDCVALTYDDTQVEVSGIYPGLRLWSDSMAALALHEQDFPLVSDYNSKRRISETGTQFHFSEGKHPLRAVYLLLPPGDLSEIIIERITPQAGLIRLVENSFHLDIGDRSAMQRMFEALTRIVSQVPLFRLQYPRRYEQLPAIRTSIINHQSAALQETPYV
jgi:hypothetical protein